MLQLFQRFLQGEVISKQRMAQFFQVSEKAIQRDIEDLRSYLAMMSHYDQAVAIEYDAKQRGYRLRGEPNGQLNSSEVYSIIKILLESRAFSGEEMNRSIEKLLHLVSPEESKLIQEMVRNERFLYVPVQHNQPMFQKMWDVGRAVRQQRRMKIAYKRVGDSSPVMRLVEPVGLIFSEFYFYALAYLDGYPREFPVIYRLDRIESYELMPGHFHIPDQQRFQEGEFRKRVQFMQTGQLLTITFRFWGASLEAVLDRLPNAVVTMDGDTAIIEAKVFGRGIKMWLLSQAQYVEVVKPAEFREELKQTIEAMATLYKNGDTRSTEQGMDKEAP
nr:WYL domain-containing transcriptional regulator [Brevibacillus fulvus]